jgi:erythromycin esterase
MITSLALLYGIATQSFSHLNDDWVSRHGVALSSDSELIEPAQVLISKEMDGVQVVGLGEASHGISEFFKMKATLIKYLVAHEDFSLIMLEATFGETVFLNQYISGERDDIEAILKGMPLWYFKVEEFRDLLKWLREFNVTHDNRVQLFGMEMQYVDRSLKEIKTYLDKVNPETSEIWDQFGIDRIGNATANAKEFFFLWQPMSGEVLREHMDLLVKLRENLESNRTNYIAKSGAAEFDLVRRHVVVLEQFISASTQSEEAIKHQMRDYFMFLNLEWTRSYCGNPKTIVWAHNEHIWKQPGNGGYDVLGRQLDRRYGQAYFAFGFDFGEGTYRAPGNDGWEHLVPNPEVGSLSHRMLQLGKPHFLLDIRSAIGAGEPIPASVTLRASSGGYTPMLDGKILYDRDYSLTDRYDALVFINRVTLPKLLK